MACYFQLKDVTTHCCKYTRWIGNNRQNIKMDDIFQINDLAVDQGLQKLVSHITCYIQEVEGTKAFEEFLKSDSKSLSEMLVKLIKI